ncbi:MAG: hypothetical protein IPL96_17725 [Holophagaceae bacterium]|nr:hypothetical protein [Holophagaceae bacterium]
MLPWLPFHLSPWLQLGLSMAVVFTRPGHLRRALAQAAQAGPPWTPWWPLGAFTARPSG